jgi:16S rRNA (adenine1518-N6/adenine1519-N6)-dimethyltransferase
MSAPAAAALPTSRRDWAALLARLGVRPSKGLGQHFLFERGVVQRMVRSAGIGPEDLVLEVGPGLGILTSELLRRARAVTAIELDRRLAEHLRGVFGEDPRFRLVEGDALQIATAEVIPPGEPFVVAANLPYAVATAVLRHLLEQEPRPRRLALMVQKEVAERIAAEPPAMTILGVAAQFYAEPRIAFEVSPSVFLPPPKVESAVVLLETMAEPPLPEGEQARFFRVVNAGFRQKRKQVANSLAAELGLEKGAVVRWLREAGVDPMRRAQTLSVEEWVTLARSAPELDAPSERA